MADAALSRPGRGGFAALRIARGHIRLCAAIAAGFSGYLALRGIVSDPTRGILAWDGAVLLYLLLIVALFAPERADRMAADAARQEEGEWIVFAFSVIAIAVSFGAIVAEFSAIKAVTAGEKGFHVALVGATLLLSWLMSQTVFALRYAHEFYTSSDGSGTPDGGLEFPGEPRPDYLDFIYFAVVLGMTFQVSDVQITSRKFRRVAALHGLLGFLFNTIIIALTVNLASGLLS